MACNNICFIPVIMIMRYEDSICSTGGSSVTYSTVQYSTVPYCTTHEVTPPGQLNVLFSLKMFLNSYSKLFVTSSSDNLELKLT